MKLARKFRAIRCPESFLHLAKIYWGVDPPRYFFLRNFRFKTSPSVTPCNSPRYTHTRYVLHWAAAYSMRTEQVKQVWEYILAHYIQPIRGKSAEVEIEVRSDNGKQFSSKSIVEFFEENQLTQLFTHPYTPEENDHIESFHKTLGKALKSDEYDSLEDVENRFVKFYTTYNNLRSHGSIIGLPPAIFLALDDLGHAEVIINQEKRTSSVRLNVAYQNILDLQGINDRKYRAIRA